VGDPLRDRRAEGARGGIEELVAENERGLLDRENAALDVIDVAAAQLVEIANMAVRGEAARRSLRVYVGPSPSASRTVKPASSMR